MLIDILIDQLPCTTRIETHLLFFWLLSLCYRGLCKYVGIVSSTHQWKLIQQNRSITVLITGEYVLNWILNRCSPSASSSSSPPPIFLQLIQGKRQWEEKEETLLTSYDFTAVGKNRLKQNNRRTYLHFFQLTVLWVSVSVCMCMCMCREREIYECVYENRRIKDQQKEEEKKRHETMLLYRFVRAGNCGWWRFRWRFVGVQWRALLKNVESIGSIGR